MRRLRWFVNFVKDIVKIYTGKRVSRSAAEFAYFLTLSIFPFLICVTAIISSLEISEQTMLLWLNDILPEHIVGIIQEYIDYVLANFSQGMLFLGITVMATSASAAFRSIMNIMVDIQGKARYHGLLGMLISFIVAVLFLFAIYLSGVIIVTGSWFINFLVETFGLHQFAYVWQWLRFVVLFVIMVGVVYAIYWVSAPKEPVKRQRIIGAAAASVALVGFSMVFSVFIGISSKYPVVYGSLASFIILMVWSYTCGIILIMGNVLNIVINGKRCTVLKVE